MWLRLGCEGMVHYYVIRGQWQECGAVPSSKHQQSQVVVQMECLNPSAVRPSFKFSNEVSFALPPSLRSLSLSQCSGYEIVYNRVTNLYLRLCNCNVICNEIY